MFGGGGRRKDAVDSRGMPCNQPCGDRRTRHRHAETPNESPRAEPSHKNRPSDPASIPLPPKISSDPPPSAPCSTHTSNTHTLCPSQVDIREKDDVQPALGYQWATEWAQDLTYTRCDAEGWSYALNFSLLSVHMRQR